MTHQVADVIRWLLIQEGLGTDPASNADWPVYCNRELDNPGRCITVYDTEGTSDGRAMATGRLLEHPGIQVRVRAEDGRTGRAKIDAVREALAEAVYDELVRVDSSRYVVQCLARIGNVLPLGKVEPNTRRNAFTLNALAVVKEL